MMAVILGGSGSGKSAYAEDVTLKKMPLVSSRRIREKTFEQLGVSKKKRKLSVISRVAVVAAVFASLMITACAADTMFNDGAFFGGFFGNDFTVYIGGSSSFDFSKKEYNKYDAVMRYATENGYAKEEVLYVGDDFGDGGGDSERTERAAGVREGQGAGQGDAGPAGRVL